MVMMSGSLMVEVSGSSVRPSGAVVPTCAHAAAGLRLPLLHVLSVRRRGRQRRVSESIKIVSIDDGEGKADSVEDAADNSIADGQFGWFRVVQFSGWFNCQSYEAVHV